MWYFLRLAVLVILSTSFGCVEVQQMLAVQGQAEIQALRQMFGVPEPQLTHSQRYNIAMARRDYLAAIAIIRQEMAAPEKNSVKYLVTLRLAAIAATTKYADNVGLTSGIEHDVIRWYNQALTIAQKDEKQRANLYNHLVVYYETTNRPGLGITLAQREAVIWERRKNPYRTFLAYGNLASLYALMGDYSKKAFYRKSAADIARKIFNLDNFGTPDGGDGDEWLNYCVFLEKQLTDLRPGPGSVDEAFRIFARYERIIQRKIKPNFSSYLLFANVLIELGQIELGLNYLKRAERTALAEIAKNDASEKSLICLRSPVYLRLGRLSEARDDIRRCLAMDPSEERSIPFQRYSGLIYEASGDLDRAIEAFEASAVLCEQSRKSFSLDQRTTFFNNPCQHSFFGLIRNLARRFTLTKNPRDFTAALLAAERMRSRQFGEVLEHRRGQPLHSTDLVAVQNALGSNELLLDYVLTEKDIIVFSVTKEEYTLETRPFDHNKTSELAQEIARALNSPGAFTSSEATHQGLATLSDDLLMPVQQEWLKSKSRLVVLLDGAMYRFPFDLLSLDGHALVECKIVHAAPSLRYLVWARSQRPEQTGAGFFAIADPSFNHQSSMIPGLTQDEPAIVTDNTRGGQLVRSFAPLPDTRTEVQAIADLFTGEPVRVLLGPDARESALKKLDLGSYRYIHIATHGFGSGEVTGISEPALAFSSESDQDGVLLASEAQELQLRADLTVLSACKTGVGEIYAGEGAMGLSRSFLLAGSRSVLVSLWEVNSKITSAFMVDFYKRLREGKDAAEALQKTKIAIIHNEGESVTNAQGTPIARQDPYYWAPFVLVAP